MAEGLENNNVTFEEVDYMQFWYSFCMYYSINVPYTSYDYI